MRGPGPRPIVVAAVLVAACAVQRDAPPPGPPADPFAGRWEIAFVRPGTSLRGLCVVSADVVWCSGTRGTVLRSVDGGGSWQQVGPPDAAALDFRSVWAADGQHAVVAVAGEPARVYRTTDGGERWDIALADERPGAFFDALAFFDRDHGLLLGDPIDGELQLLATADGGASWQPLAAGAVPAATAGEACFAASGSCLRIRGDRVDLVTGGSVSRCLSSLDRGGSWRAAALPLVQGEPSQGAFSVAFCDRDRGVAVGGDYRQPAATAGTAAITADGGRSWRTVEGGALGYRSAVACLADGRSCIAVGDHGASVSRDGGATWQPFGSDGFHAVGVHGDLVIAVGAAGRVGRLVQSGAER